LRLHFSCAESARRERAVIYAFERSASAAQGKVPLTAFERPVRPARSVDASRDERTIAKPAADALERARSTSGSILPDGVRDRLERGFATDFAGVRVHTEPASARAAAELGARAFTVGRHMHFARGAYDPHSAAGFELLAHEAAHTLQHRTAHGSSSAALTAPHDAAEREADQAARIVSADPAARARVTGAAQPDHLHRAPDRLALEANAVKADLRTVIAGGTWKEIRKRAYPAASAAGIARARERHAGNRPDLTGLGKLSALDHFAQAVRGIQSNWGALGNADERVKALGKAASAELTAADVPGFLALDKEPLEIKAFFSPDTWGFTISEALVSGATLDNKDAGEVANATLHESRHAEQNFLAARYSAGANKKDAGAIVSEQGIPQQIAEKAVAKKFDATTDPKIADLGQRMYTATVTDGDANGRISADDGFKDLNSKRAIAQNALTALEASVTPETISAAKTARDDLKAAILVVEQKYPLYRNIPYEADAHEVGDAAELAFRGWPADPSAPPQRTSSERKRSPVE
jgi:hypothetical protein